MIIALSQHVQSCCKTHTLTFVAVNLWDLLVPRFYILCVIESGMFFSKVVFVGSTICGRVCVLKVSAYVLIVEKLLRGLILAIVTRTMLLPGFEIRIDDAAA